MRTTLELPDDLMRAIKLRAVEENRRLKDTVADLLRQALSSEARPTRPVLHRATLPLIQCAHEARPDEEMTPERVAQLLIEEDETGVGNPVR